ncbi:MAG: phage tail tube protein, partial [Phycisphaerales bacterium]
IAEVTKINPPSIANPESGVTYHGNGGWKEFIAGGLKELGEFTISINYLTTSATHNAATGLIADVVAGTLRNYQLVFPDSVTWTFPTLVKEFAPGGADAQNPERLTAECTFRPSGTPTLA